MTSTEFAKRKSENAPGTLMLFRIGDFYALYHEDANTAAKKLGLTLTTRDKNSPEPVPMAGFPYWQLEGYLRCLVNYGHRIAVYDLSDTQKGNSR